MFKKDGFLMTPFASTSFSSPQMQELLNFRHALHQHPELSEKEYQTTTQIRKALSKLGLEELNFDLPTGVIAILRGKHRGSLVALRADIDALPVDEQTGWAYASQISGMMHACGHDVHTTALLGAAMLLSQHRDELSGDVLFLFQPAEENMTGAERIIATSTLRQLPVRACFGMHVWPQVELGTVGLHAGAVTAAKDVFQITVCGEGGHSSSPHLTHDSIVCGAELILALQSIVSRNLNPFDPAVLSVCSVHAGSCDNVLPDQMTLLGSTRTFSKDSRKDILNRIREISDNVAAAHRCRAEVTIVSGSPSVSNSPDLMPVAKLAVQSTCSESGGVECGRVPFSEDFSLYRELAPSFFYLFGVHKPGQERYPLHSPLFCPDDRTIASAAALLANSAAFFLEKEAHNATSSYAQQ